MTTILRNRDSLRFRWRRTVDGGTGWILRLNDSPPQRSASARSSLVRWQGHREIVEFLVTHAAGARMPGPTYVLKALRTLGYRPPAAPPGDSDRRYIVATVAIRTQASSWEIESTVKTADRMPRACTKINPE